MSELAPIMMGMDAPKWAPLCRCGRELDPENGPSVQVRETFRRTIGEHGYRVVEQDTFAGVFCSLPCARDGIAEYIETRDET